MRLDAPDAHFVVTDEVLGMPESATSRKMHFPSCASGRIGRTGRKLKIMTEATIAPTSGRTAPNPHVEGAHHDNTLL